MKVFLKNAADETLVESLILPAAGKELPLRSEGWQFTWRRLGKTEGALLFKLCSLEEPDRIEGMLMLSLINSEMLFMNNVEIAPRNYGSTGQLLNVAGCLLAFACYKSFELGRGHYTGFLSFDSKTELIELYQQKYGATHAMGHKMFFDPQAAKALMERYLLIDLQGKLFEDE